MDYDGYIVTSRPSEHAKRSGKRFFFHAAEVFFRRWPLYVLPIVLLVAIGFLQAKKTTVDFESVGTLSVTSNPFVASPSSGTTAFSWETPATSMARGINELLSTDAFVTQVATTAGLAPALDANQLTFDDLRKSVYAVPSGNTLLRVVSTWGDATTAFQLADATIAGYVEYVFDAVASDSQAAIDFYQNIADESSTEVDAAQSALDNYVSQLAPVPIGGERSTAEQLKIESLTAKLQSAQTQLDDAEAQIQAANLSVQTAKSEAGKVLKVVDAPELPTSPLSTSKKKVVTVAMYSVLGALIAAAALVVSAMLDNTVRSSADVAATGFVVVATVPVVRNITTLRIGGPPTRRTGRKSKAVAARVGP